MSIQHGVKDLKLVDEGTAYFVPLPIDGEVARLQLHSMGVNIDQLMAKQEKYLASWEEGT